MYLKSRTFIKSSFTKFSNQYGKRKQFTISDVFILRKRLGGFLQCCRATHPKKLQLLSKMQPDISALITSQQQSSVNLKEPGHSFSFAEIKPDILRKSTRSFVFRSSGTSCEAHNLHLGRKKELTYWSKSCAAGCQSFPSRYKSLSL